LSQSVVAAVATVNSTHSPPGNTWGTHGTMSNRHNEGANIGFYDGHAKWMSREAAWAMPYYDFN
jgi:prepilin-type processing-associated H-X9-DG protein